MHKLDKVVKRLHCGLRRDNKGGWEVWKRGGQVRSGVKKGEERRREEISEVCSDREGVRRSEWRV